MKTKKIALVLMAVALVLVFAACGGGGGGGSVYTNTSDGKQITITELSNDFKGSSVSIFIYSQDSGSNIQASGTKEFFYNDSVTIALFERSYPWTKSGSFYVEMTTRDGYYLYTDGKTLETLGLDWRNIFPSEEYYEKLPKVSITDDVTIIPFSKFGKYR